MAYSIMRIISCIMFMYFYLKGVSKFRTKDYVSAQPLFEKALKYDESQDNELFYQYYGQTLLCLNKIDESFIYLSRSYDIYNKNGWEVLNGEEYRLSKDTLDALKYLDENFKLTINNFKYDIKIRIR